MRQALEHCGKIEAIRLLVDCDGDEQTDCRYTYILLRDCSCYVVRILRLRELEQWLQSG